MATALRSSVRTFHANKRAATSAALTSYSFRFGSPGMGGSSRLRPCALLAASMQGGGSGGQGNTNGGGNKGGGRGGWSSGRGGEGWRAPIGSTTALAALSWSMAAAPTALAENKKSPANSDELDMDDLIDQLSTVAGPLLQNLGFSGIVGVATAAALKFVGKSLAVVVGLVFAAVQGLAYLGYVTVNWQKVNDEVTKLLDLDGDGKLDGNDVKVFTKNAAQILAQGVPSVSGFVGGFVLGLRLF